MMTVSMTMVMTSDDNAITGDAYDMTSDGNANCCECPQTGDDYGDDYDND